MNTIIIIVIDIHIGLIRKLNMIINRVATPSNQRLFALRRKKLNFKIILSEGPRSCRIPEKRLIEVASFIKHLNPYFTSILQSYLKAVFIERFNRTLLHSISKPMFISDDDNWVNLLTEAITTY